MRNPSIKRAVDALASQELRHHEVAAGCLDVVQRAVPFDQATWYTLDPVTLLPTGFEERVRAPLLETMHQDLAAVHGRSSREYQLELLGRRMHVELAQDDSLSVGPLSRSPRHVATLHGVTNGRPDRNARWKTFPFPGMVEDELRLGVVDANECWGLVVLHRMEGVFTPEEQRIAGQLSRPLGGVVRLSLLREAVRAGGGLTDPPGLMLLDGGRLAHVSDEALHLLGERVGGHDWPWVAVLDAMRATRGRGSLVVDGAHGPVTVHTTAFGPQAAIIVERVRPYQLADRLVRTYGLTPRERDVCWGISRGWPTRRVAFELDLADYTVQDHLRSIFKKVGARSRGEVLSKLFFDRYLPEHHAENAPSPYGWFLES